LQLAGAGATDIGLYVEGSHLPAPVLERIRAATALRKEMGTLEEAIDGYRERLGDLASRGEELRESLRALEKVKGSDDVKKKLVASLAQTTADADAIGRKLGLDSEALATARTKLQDSLREISLDAS
jgi:chromosome segregation ATPase